jgi:hypothetical protein
MMDTNNIVLDLDLMPSGFYTINSTNIFSQMYRIPVGIV